MLRKTSYVLFAAFVLMLASLVQSQSVHANSLSDIPSDTAKEINYLISQGVVKGYPDNTFRPNTPVSRQQAATMVGRALNLNGTQRTTVFPDVPSDSYASGYIQSSYERGIINGYLDGTFRPYREINRGEMAYLISKAFSFTATSGNQYSDVSDSGQLSTVIDRITTAGISNGYPDGTYRPDRTITREEFALFVARSMNPDYRVNSGADSGVIDQKMVIANVLNVRTGPSTGYREIGELYEGQTVSIYGFTGDWVKVAFNGTTGYVHGDFLVDIPETNNEPTIAIDAGHGDHDPGASGNGLIEKEINLAVAKRVEDYLENAGINVVMTRDDDTFLELEERVSYAVNHGADTFVSIHSNAAADEDAWGVETYYSSAAMDDRAYSSYMLAQFIQERLVDAMNSNDRGVKDKDFHVIYKTPLPSVLVELGFVTNDSDAYKLGSSYYRDRAAKAIYLGVLDYYNWKQQ